MSDIDLEIAALKLWISLYEMRPKHEQWEVDAYELHRSRLSEIESSGPIDFSPLSMLVTMCCMVKKNLPPLDDRRHRD